jgi:hypothetical protein
MPAQSKMKFIIILILFLKVTFVLSQSKNDCDSIPWTKSTKLSWSDFKASPDTTVDFGAISHIGINYKLKQINDTVLIKIVCCFKPCLSWSKVKNSDTLLIHEQGHFNIAEYFRRLFIKRIFEQQFDSQNMGNIISKIYSNISSEEDLFDKQYDNETDYSKDRKQQNYWTQYNLGLLNSLKDFDKQEIQLLLAK